MKSPRSFRVEAIVLRHRDWGEADRMLSLYTPQRGKISAVAKGARKMRSRKAGHLQPFTRITVQLALASGPYIITQVETLDAYLPLRENLQLTGHAAYIVELLDRFTYAEEETNPAIFLLLSKSLARLSRGDDIWTLVRYYEMRLLDHLGFRPQLFDCAVCGEEIKAEDQFFSAARGGAVCPECAPSQLHARPVSMEALKYIRHFQRSAYVEARRADPPQKIRAEVENLMQFYITYMLERGLNSPSFIKEVEKR